MMESTAKYGAIAVLSTEAEAVFQGYVKVSAIR